MFFLGGILHSYFAFLKLRKRSKTLAVSGTQRLISWLNTYVFKLTIIIIVAATIGSSLFTKALSAEELQSSIILTQIIPNSDEQPAQLIQEGPLAKDSQPNSRTYLDSSNDLSDELAGVPSYAPDTDTDNAYTTTENETAIVAPVITDTQNGQTGRTSIETYVVKAGDTIGTISQKFGININTILWQNNLQWNSTIQPGQSLSILPVTGVAHTIKKGDTISQIAKKYQVDPNVIIDHNKLADASDIRIGEVLVVPNGIKPTTVAYQAPQPKNLPEILRDIFIPPSAGPGQETGSQFLWPLLSHRMTQYFTFRHSGIDVGDKTGNPIYAAESGRVEVSGWSRGGYGYHVIINHGNGIKTLYGHSSKLLVKAGDTVERGQVIALIGSTGRSTGPHLHFEVRINGRVTNPLNYIR